MKANEPVLGILFCISVLAGLSHAQTPQPLVSNEPVLTIHGPCPETRTSAIGADGCTVVVSRQQFDDLMSIVAPNAKPTATAKQAFARTYTDTIALAGAAHRLGIDDSPEYRETVQWLQRNALAGLLRRRLERESAVVSDAEIQAYYREQSSRFQEVRLSRLVLPRTNFAATDREKFEQEAERIALALRERAANGEDMEGLQKEAYDALGFRGQVPATDVGNRRMATLPSEIREDIVSLKPGEVSKVEKEAYSFVTYKVEAKRTLSENQVRDEIRRELSKQKLERALKSITGNIQAEWNEKYFGATATQ